MRILIYSTNYAPELVGVGKYNSEMAAWLAEQGHQVQVLCANPYYPQWRIYDGFNPYWYSVKKEPGLDVTHCPIYLPARVTGLTRIIHELSFTLTSSIVWLKYLFFSRHYDVIMAICPPLQTGIWPLIYRFFRRKTRVLFHIQDLQVDAARELKLVSNERLLRFLERIEKFILEKSDMVSSISDGMCNKIESKGHRIKQLLQIRNWVDLGAIKPAKSSLFRQRWNVPAKTRVILYSGNLGQKQGLPIIIEMAERFKNRNLLFIIVGDGVSKPTLQEMVQQAGLKNVRFFGLQPYEELNDLIALGDIHLVVQKKGTSNLVMPSKLTTLLAAGALTIVSTDLDSDFYQLISANEIGIPVEAENHDALYAAINRALKMKPAQMKKKARSFAQNNLNKDNILTELVKSISSS